MILIPDERHVIGKCLADILIANPSVHSASHRVPHPLSNDVLVCATGSQPELELVNSALDELKRALETLLRDVSAAR